jgi:hypothetical protein
VEEIISMTSMDRIKMNIKEIVVEESVGIAYEDCTNRSGFFD